jgi:argininosuccinate synthase
MAAPAQGNDQVRFDMIFNILIPGVEIITPIRDMKLSREEEISYLKSKGVEMNFEKAAYSINKGLWGTSVGGKETLQSKGILTRRSMAHTGYQNRQRRNKTAF